MCDHPESSKQPKRNGADSSFYSTSTDYMVRLKSSGRKLYAQVAQRALWQYAPPQCSPLALDFGSGTGEFARLLAGVGYTVSGVDVSHLFLREGTQQHGTRKELRFCQVGAKSQLPFAAETFHVVTAVNVIEHVGEPSLALDEIARVLRPGGLVVMTFPNLLSPLRPLKRFLSREHMARYGPETGESSLDALRLIWRNLVLLVRMLISGRPILAPRVPDFNHANLYYELGYGADYDAQWLCNPVDVRLAFRSGGVTQVEARPFALAEEQHLGRVGELRTRFPAALASPVLWIGRKG